MATGRQLPPREKLLPGSVIEQNQGDRAFLIVQESPARRSVVETWDDLMEVCNRLLGRINTTLREMNADLATFDQKLSRDLRKTAAKIATNQRLLDELVAGRS
jgi:hypothetical protein